MTTIKNMMRLARYEAEYRGDGRKITISGARQKAFNGVFTYQPIYTQSLTDPKTLAVLAGMDCPACAQNLSMADHGRCLDGSQVISDGVNLELRDYQRRHAVNAITLMLYGNG